MASAENPNERIARLEGQIDSLQENIIPSMQRSIDKTETQVEPVKQIRLGVYAVGVVLVLFGVTFGTFLPILYNKVTDLRETVDKLEGPVKEWEKKVTDSEGQIDQHVAEKKDELVNELKTELRADVLRNLPVGTILAYYPPPNAELPAGWKYCDETPVDDDASPFHGKSVNLAGRVPRGVAGAEAVGALGKNAGISTDDGTGTHQHRANLPDLTGSIALKGDPIAQHGFAVLADGAWINNGTVKINLSGATQPTTGHHRHDLAGDIVTLDETAQNSFYGGQHSHTIGAELVPNYVAVRFIIRIK